MSSPPRFLCDEMLGQICRYLRAAGYDTLFANGGHQDRKLLRQCHEEGRYFLTQDQLVAEHKVAHGVALILPQGDSTCWLPCSVHISILTGSIMQSPSIRRSPRRT